MTLTDGVLSVKGTDDREEIYVEYHKDQDEISTRSVETVEHRLHPHTAFWTGFVRCLGNPGVLLFWLTISATFISHEWMDDTWSSRAACLGGVALGCFLWFTLLSFLVSRSHGKFSTNTLLRMSQFSGASVLAVAIVTGVRLVRLLAHH